jgi:exodeoxyribonuclease X
VRFRVIDIETTGLAPPAEIVEIGRVDVVIDEDQVVLERPMARLYRPLNGIPPEIMAVHHITEEDFSFDTPVCTEDRLRLAVWGGATPDVLVAHNCSFERLFIPTRITKTLPWICTFKVALRAWPDAPRHTNQVLRYWRRLKLDVAFAMPPHRAAPDAWVTAHLLVELNKSVSVADMVLWTSQPAQYASVPFGKFRGRPWREVPPDYLDWIVRQNEMDEGVVSSARAELRRRDPRS